MKLIRFQDVSGKIYYGEQVNDHLARIISGDIFEKYTVHVQNFHDYQL